MEVISRKGEPSTYIEGMRPIDKLQFIRDSESTYPIKDNIKPPTAQLNNKKIYYTVEELVFGQFIMLEQIITGKTKLPNHRVDLEIAKLIIRPSQHKVFDNEDPSLEIKNEGDILDLDVREVYYVLDKFIENRNKTLFMDFSGVFYDLNNDDDDSQENDEEQTTSDMLFNQQWYWYSIVRMLSGEDIHKYEHTYMLPMSIVLPEMSYIAQRSKIESAKQRQSQALRKL